MDEVLVVAEVERRAPFDAREGASNLLGRDGTVGGGHRSSLRDACSSRAYETSSFIVLIRASGSSAAGKICRLVTPFSLNAAIRSLT